MRTPKAAGGGPLAAIGTGAGARPPMGGGAKGGGPLLGEVAPPVPVELVRWGEQLRCSGRGMGRKGAGGIGRQPAPASSGALL